MALRAALSAAQGQGTFRNLDPRDATDRPVIEEIFTAPMSSGDLLSDSSGLDDDDGPGHIPLRDLSSSADATRSRRRTKPRVAVAAASAAGQTDGTTSDSSSARDEGGSLHRSRKASVAASSGPEVTGAANETSTAKDDGSSGSSDSAASSTSYSSPISGPDRLYEFLDKPTSSTGALCYSIIIFSCIIISVLNFLIESSPEFWDTDNEAMFVVESLIVAVFTFDYFAKLATYSGSRPKWCLEFLNVIDLLSIIPFYVELVVTAASTGQSGLSGFVVLRVLRLFRVFRILKIAKYFTLLHVVGETLRRSLAGFVLLLFTLVLSLVLFASMEFYAEQTVSSFDPVTRKWIYTPEYGGTESNFQSVPDAMWWCLVTLTTVGYGDQVPVSPLGKAVASLAIVSGLLVLAFPLTIMGSNFGEVWAEYRAREFNSDKESLEAAKSMDARELVALCREELLQARARLDETRDAIAEIHNRYARITTLVTSLSDLQLK
mmetsp:Transcript_6658/g.21558  ORF Transcript_6658/g.21558 Transcript_6658/m.21558 type:complete len:491 (-) Transcript_6658:1071-2543(-)